MRPPCELIVRFVLPVFRSLVARELVEKYEFAQVEAAKKLGITQAAISQYMSSRRGKKQLKKFASLPVVRSAVSEMTSDIVSSKISTTDTIEMFCKLCVVLRNKDTVCTLHRDSANLPLSCHICHK